MCGLPVSGKTTTAGRLHAVLGGTLIRSCDVYQRLGICLPDWVARTRGFTEAVGAYEQVRDHAYEEMARLLEESLAAGETLAILDAVHCERAKRAIVFDLCHRYAAAPVLVWCRCDDLAEMERRLAARRGREAEPAHEASDVSVYRHIVSLWDDPLEDNLTKDSPGPVTFSHAQHLQKVKKCAECHTKIFKMKKGQTGPLTMEKMKAGEQCGTCHNGKTQVAGKTVFTVDDQANCERCHKK